MLRSLCLTGLLLGLTVWAYQSMWSATWVYEDRATITTAAQHSGGWVAWRSLSAWTWRWTSTPRAAHLLGLGLHGVIGALVGVATWRLGLTPLGAWTAAALWLLSPMTVETAAYAKARADQIALIGILLAVIAAAECWWSWWGIAGIVVGALIAVGGKEAGVVVLLLVPLTVWHGRTRPLRTAPWWAHWWAPAMVAAAIVMAGVERSGGLRALVNADGELGVGLATDVTAAQWGFAQAGAAWYWLLASLWPAWVTPDADIDSLSSLTRGMGLFTLVTLAGLAWRLRGRLPVVSLGCAWVVLALVPRLLIQTPRSYLSASQFAVAFVGVTLLAGYGVQRLKAHWSSPSWSAVCW